MAEPIYRIEEDSTTGHLHKRYADETGRFRLTDERCQRDQSSRYVILREADVENRALKDFCGWDWPEHAAQSFDPSAAEGTEFTS